MSTSSAARAPVIREPGGQVFSSSKLSLPLEVRKQEAKQARMPCRSFLRSWILGHQVAARVHAPTHQEQSPHLYRWRRWRARHTQTATRVTYSLLSLTQYVLKPMSLSPYQVSRLGKQIAESEPAGASGFTYQWRRWRVPQTQTARRVPYSLLSLTRDVSKLLPLPPSFTNQYKTKILEPAGVWGFMCCISVCVFACVSFFFGASPSIHFVRARTFLIVFLSTFFKVVSVSTSPYI